MQEFCNVKKLANLLSSSEESDLEVYNLYDMIRYQINTFEDAEKAIEDGTITEEKLLALLEDIENVSDAHIGFESKLEKVRTGLISSRIVVQKKRRLL